jgi:hypothetical protein
VISGTPDSHGVGPFGISVTVQDSTRTESPAQSLSLAILPAFASTMNTLTSSASQSIFGQPVTLTASVSPGTATGKVTFYEGVSVLGTTALTNGQATLTNRLLPPGTGSLRAYYSGDATYGPASSAPLVLTEYTLPQTGFQPAVDYAVGTAPNGIMPGDFNGDGNTDYAVANVSSNNISVLLGNGDGTFQAAANYKAGASPTAVAVGDFNGDGNADLAVGNAESASVAILLGNGDGSFQAGITYAVPGGAQSIVIADLNGDGSADLAVASIAGGIGVLLGDGDGTFQPVIKYFGYFGGASRLFEAKPTSFIAIGDFNGDGKADLATNSLLAGLSVLLGNGDGTFQAAAGQAAAGYGTGNSTHSATNGITVGDFNGDGKADLALINKGANNVAVLLGNGDGTFQAEVNYDTGTGPASIATGDFNGDGKADLAVANSTSGSVSLLTGNGDGTFQSAVNLNAGAAVNALAVGELTGDGRTALAIIHGASNRMGILLGTQGTTPQTISFAPPGNVSFGIAPFTIGATADSGLTACFASNTTSVCTISGNTVTILASGECSITASQAGNTTYAPAVPVTQNFTVLFNDASPDAFYSDAVNLLARYTASPRDVVTTISAPTRM